MPNWSRVVTYLNVERQVSMSEFTPVMPHGDISPVFDDVFFVTGTTRPKFMDLDWQFSRNMTIVRESGNLTLINSVRLDDAGLAALDALGRVVNVVRLGAFHGIDDRFYVDRYAPRLWALPGMTHDGGLATDAELIVGGPMPVADASLFVFATSTQPEGILRLDRAGGILVSCDSLQNWSEADEFFDAGSAARMDEAGFFHPANIGPGWRQACSPEAADFVRLKELSFRHLLSAHGIPLIDTAHADLSATFAKVFDI